MPEEMKDNIRDIKTPNDAGVLSDSMKEDMEKRAKEEREEDEKLLKQIKSEFEISEKYKAPQRRKWIKQMKMMKNEKKNKEKIGDETMYTIFDTLLSALTSDKLAHKMEPTEMGDIEKAELIDALMLNDYRKMQMDDIDEYWTWWSIFAGHAVLDLSEFNETILCTAPEYINPFLDYPDPKALSLHGVGVKRTGSARFYGYIVETTVADMEEAGIDVKSFDKALANAQTDLSKMNKYLPEDLKTGDNESRSLLVFYTRFNRKWVRVLCSTDHKVIFKKQYLKGRPPLVDRLVGIDPSEWYPRTVPDLLEDKHRAKANTMNIAMDNVREQQKSIYLSKRGNVRLDALANAQSGDIIEVKELNGIQAMEKPSIKNDVEWLLQKLDASAQEVSASPDIQQGVVMDEKRTLGELGLVASGSKNRYGMRARIFGRSMRLFWTIWYDQAQEYFDESVHSKMIKISGVYGPEWRKIKKSDITLEGDFDISITSKVISDQKDAIERVNFMEFHKVASSDPSYNIREGIKEIGRRSGLNTQKINFFMKKSVDEKEAEKENILLEENKLTDGKDGVIFHIRQDHEAHIREHMKCQNQGKAWKAHLDLHYEADIFLKNNPDMAGFLKQNPSDSQITQENTNESSIGQMVTPNNYTPGALATL